MAGESSASFSAPTSPPVLQWFKAYLGLLIAMYLLCPVIGLVMLWQGMQSADADTFELVFSGAVLLAAGPVFVVALVLPFFLPRKPWVWTCDLVLICVGMTSCCILAASIPLLIYWIKPETKQWFGRV